jgi:large subunit ribosomal protein L28
MSKVCQLTGKTVAYGNNVSHSNNRTRRRFLPNLQKKRIWVAEENKFVTLKISTRAIRTLDKKGYTAMLKEAQAKGLMQ